MVKQDGRGILFVFYTFILLVSCTMLYPFLHVIAVSISDYASSLKNPLMIIPQNITFEAFYYVISNPLIGSCYKNTVVVTIIGTLIGLALTVMTAYPLSKKHFRFRGIMMNLLIFTMLFNGGLIPNYLLIKNIGLLNTLWALILPGAMTGFNVILVKTFFESIPESLEEAAKIDGATDFYLLWKIILPLSAPIIATVSLFMAVTHWNSFFNAVVYIRDTDKWTLQLLLREVIMSSNSQLMSSGGNLAEVNVNVNSQSLNYATLVVAILPILCIYPFLQRYFVKGVMVGAVKG